MDIALGEALLIVGVLLAVAAALSGVTRRTVLSISVLAVTVGHRARGRGRGFRATPGTPACSRSSSWR